MPIPRLQLESAALLVVDVQERLMPSIADAPRLIQHCSILLRMAGLLRLPFLVTEQNPRGLGRTVDAVAAAMPDPAQRIEKTCFSATVDLVLERLRAWRTGSVLVCGIETHVCVLQTVLDLQAAGHQAFVITDAVSGSQPDQAGPALARMQAAGAVTTGVMSAMYELLRDANHPAFRPCLELAKSIIRSHPIR
jgi:nicotinamidase-related amidase